MFRCGKKGPKRKLLKKVADTADAAASVVFYSIIVSMIYYRVIFKQTK